jgi:glycosyltransferase involved in cell wall biosynthesis
MRVLVLSYYFPPIGGAGAQRPARMVRHLLTHGWEPVVVTGPGPGNGRWSPADDSLAREVPAEVEVLRVPGPEPAASAGFAARRERWLRHPTPWERWWVEGAVATGRGARGVDLVYCWLSPFETTEAAARLAAELGVPWVADHGDPWALDEMMVYPTRVHRRLEVARMRDSLRGASAIVMSTNEAVARVRASLPELAEIPVVAVPNGFEAADFAGEAPPRRDDGVFRIVHTGYLHTELGLRERRKARVRRVVGGAARGVDFLTRSHVYLVEAVDRLIERQPELAGRIEIQLAGLLTDADLGHLGRTGSVRTLGYLAHDETLDLLRAADLLFLPMQELPPGQRATIVPGKTYEYLGAGRPILAAVPDGDARDILCAAGNAFLVRPSDVDGMTRAVAAAYRRAQSGREAHTPRREVVARYEYAALAADLAGVFSDVVGRPSDRGRADSAAAA